MVGLDMFVSLRILKECMNSANPKMTGYDSWILEICCNSKAALKSKYSLDILFPKLCQRFWGFSSTYVKNYCNSLLKKATCSMSGIDTQNCRHKSRENSRKGQLLLLSENLTERANACYQALF